METNLNLCNPSGTNERFTIFNITLTNSKNPNCYDLCVFLSNGDIFNVLLSLLDDVSIKKCDKVLNIPLDNSTVFNSTQKGFIILLSTKKNIVTIMQNNAIIFQQSIYTDQPLIAYCENSFLYCPDECTVSYVIAYADKANYLKPLLLTTSKSKITHLQAHSQYKVFCIGCEDNTVEVHALQDGKIVGTTDAKEQIRFLFFTSSFGFVVCITKNFYILMSIDGDEIKRFPLTLEIESVFTFKDSRGFDYICGRYTNNLMFVFEAMYPENEKKVTNIKNNIQ